MEHPEKSTSMVVGEFADSGQTVSPWERGTDDDWRCKPDVPDSLLSQWQSMTNLMASVCAVPAALIMKAHASDIEVFVSAEVDDNPYHAGEIASLNTGLYCESVMSTRDQLLVPNALEDPKWDHNPDIALGMISYLGCPLQWPDGEIFGTICILDRVKNAYSPDIEQQILLFRDIIESHLALLFEVEQRRRTEESLRLSEEKFSKAFHSSLDGILISRMSDGRLVEVNEGFSHITEYSKEEALANSSIQLNLWADAKDREKVVAALRDHKMVQDLEVGFRTKSGKIIDALYSGNIIFIGGEAHVLSVVRDITERKRFEQELRNTLDRFYSILSNSFAALLLVSNEGIVEYANQAMCDLFDIDVPPERLHGLTAPEMIGKLTHKYESPQEILGLIQEIVAENKSFKGEEVAVHGGRTYLVDYIPIVINGKPYGRLWTHTDITARKAAEQERESLRSQLLQSQKMEAVGSLAAGIAHDFNNMLQVILGYGDMLLGGKNEGEPGYGELQKIVKTAVEASELVQKIRIFSRKADMQPVAVDLNHQISELAKLLSHSLLKTIDMDIRLGAGLGIIRADPGLMDQMVTNLSINALESMPDGGTLTIETQNIVLDENFCALHSGVDPGPHVRLTVSDTGKGISEDLVDRIFDPFFSTKQRDFHRGTGLGLSIVQGIAQQHSGLITVESQVGKGTTFKVYFPVLTTEAAAQKEAKTGGAPGGSETILLVEDEELVRDLGIRLLETFGYTVLAASDGREALEVYEREREAISLVILDIVMPRMNGKECLQGLLRINPEARVLISSGVAQDDLVKEVVDLGAKGSLLKPYGMKKLQEKVREVLDGA